MNPILTSSLMLVACIGMAALGQFIGPRVARRLSPGSASPIQNAKAPKVKTMRPAEEGDFDAGFIVGQPRLFSIPSVGLTEEGRSTAEPEASGQTMEEQASKMVEDAETYLAGLRREE